MGFEFLHFSIYVAFISLKCQLVDAPPFPFFKSPLCKSEIKDIFWFGWSQEHFEILYQKLFRNAEKIINFLIS